MLMAGALRAEGIHAGGVGDTGVPADRRAGAPADVPRTSIVSGSSASDACSNRWRYCWNNDRWWYWTPKEKWVFWNGDTWIPFEQTNASSAKVESRVTPYVTNYGGYERQDMDRFSLPVPQGSGSWSSSGTYRTDSYAGYGCTWGPGTALRNGPGR